MLLLGKGEDARTEGEYFVRSVCIGANAQPDMVWQMFLQDPLGAIGT